MKAFPYSKDNDLYFVAEIGSNHNRDINRLNNLIAEAYYSGFDAVKLQYYEADKLWHPSFKDNIESAKKGELSLEMLKEASIQAKKYNIALGCSVFNKDHVSLIQEYVDFLKISSFECLHFNLIQECKKYKKSLFVSTGMCTRAEMYSVKKMADLQSEDSIFHCISKYPTNKTEARIDIIRDMQFSFGHECTIGYSDHTRNCGAVLAAINNGAKIIEMHFDLTDLEGNETKYGHCWHPDDANDLIVHARNMFECSQQSNWLDNFGSRPDRVNIHLRSDLSDGMRPSIKARKEQQNE